MSRLRTPIVTVITGEGGSGGALAIAVGDVVIALENAVYSVISPEGCASILWRTPDEAPTAAARDADDGRRPAGARRRRHRRPRAAARAPTPITPRPRGGSRRSSSTGSRPSRRCRSTSCSRRATAATGRWGPTLRPRCRSPTPPPAGRGLGDRLRDLLDPGRRVVSGATPAWSRDEPPAREEV